MNFRRSLTSCAGLQATHVVFASAVWEEGLERDIEGPPGGAVLVIDELKLEL